MAKFVKAPNINDEYTLPEVSGSSGQVLTQGSGTTVTWETPVVGETPAITSNGSVPSLNSGITDSEVRSLIGVEAITNTFRTVGKTSGSATAGWVTVASAGGSRYSGEVIVTDGESGDHSFIRIHWMRSFADSNFSVLNCGGHANRIQGVRVLRTSDDTYGTKYLQVYVTVTSNYYVRVLKEGDTPNYGNLTALIPSTSNPAGTVVEGNQLLNLQNSTLAAEQGITVGGTVYTNSNGNSSEWNTAYGWGDHAAEGYVTSSGNTVIGTDLDINTSGSQVINTLNMDDGVITSHTLRNMTLADLGYTGATNANYITNNNELINGAGYTTYSANQAVDTSSSPSFINMYLTNAIYHTSDTNTYMSFPANDTINWATSGSEKMRITSSGNIGIGTTSPSYTLDVNGSLHSTNLNIADGIYHEGDTNTYMQFHASDQWRVVTGGTERLEVNNARTYVNGYLEASASLRAPIFYDSNNTAYYVNPASTSNLLGLKVGYNDLELEDTANTYSPEFKMQNNTHTIGIDYQNNETLRFITRSGVVTVPITFQMRAGTITAANFILSSDERKKTNIEDLTPKTINANWKSFEMKDNLGEYRTGVIAQELENDHPEFVNTNDEGFKSVKYIDLLIAKVSELEARLEKLEGNGCCKCK